MNQITEVPLLALPIGRYAEIVDEPLVEAAAGQNVMVFETSDQSAKVIWFY